jgi:uroporphyrinogen decarboxylase
MEVWWGLTVRSKVWGFRSLPDFMMAPAAPRSAHFTANPLLRRTDRERFLDACRCRAVDRPPVWLMRQAGRMLPEYRVLREQYSFLELVQTPELATEVTLQPIRRFGFDAAILFSDILVVCEAMGQRYAFRESGGIAMEFALQSRAEIDRLETGAVVERLRYVAEALPMIRSALGGQTALLGFAGSPWTLANFMIEGGSAHEWRKAKVLFHADPAAFSRLMEKLTAAVISFLRMQIRAGADAVQIFDSLGGVLAGDAFYAASGRWIEQIIEALAGEVPVIVFSKGTHSNWAALAGCGADVLSVDWTMRLADVRKLVPSHLAIQGNLDPALLCTTPEIVAAETDRLLREMRGRPGYIFNLGHGVPPSARLGNVEALVVTVQASA